MVGGSTLALRSLLLYAATPDNLRILERFLDRN